MGRSEVKVRGLTESGAKLIVVAVAAGCAGLLLAMPQPVTPTEMPALVLDPGAMEEVRSLDRQRAAQTPGDETSARLLALYRAQGRAEAAGAEERQAATERGVALQRATDAFIAAHGSDALGTLRAKAATDLPEALAGRLDADDEQAVLGSFPRMLERYGLTRDGAIVAPPFIVRTLFVARFNAILRRPLTEGFAPVEAQAYWGWLALETPDAPIERRQSALEAYAAAGGAGVAEARAVLAFEAGDGPRASHAFTALYEETGVLRYRNHAMAATQLP